MDDIDQYKCDTDSEMLDDAVEQTCFAAVHSLPSEGRIVDTYMSSDESHLLAPVAPVASAIDHDACSQSSAPG